MRNLLSVTLPRAYKTRGFVIGLLLPLLIPFFSINAAASVKNANGSYSSIADLPFSAVSLMPMIIAIIGGLYISHDYTQNNIRKKIVSGYSRTTIYMSNWITSMLAPVFIYGAYLIFTFVYGSIRCNFDDVESWGEMFKYIGYSMLSLMYFTSLVVFCCMTVKSVGGTVLSFMLYYAFALSTIIFVFVENETLIKAFVYLNPSLHLDLISSIANSGEELGMDINEDLIPVASIVMILISTLTGIGIFKKADIK